MRARAAPRLQRVARDHPSRPAGCRPLGRDSLCRPPTKAAPSPHPLQWRQTIGCAPCPARKVPWTAWRGGCSMPTSAATTARAAARHAMSPLPRSRRAPRPASSGPSTEHMMPVRSPSGRGASSTASRRRRPPRAGIRPLPPATARDQPPGGHPWRHHGKGHSACTSVRRWSCQCRMRGRGAECRSKRFGQPRVLRPFHPWAAAQGRPNRLLTTLRHEPTHPGPRASPVRRPQAAAARSRRSAGCRSFRAPAMRPQPASGVQHLGPARRPLAFLPIRRRRCRCRRASRDEGATRGRQRAAAAARLRAAAQLSRPSRRHPGACTRGPAPLLPPFRRRRRRGNSVATAAPTSTGGPACRPPCPR